jgi:anaerobic magnesium-protoporphyrin IX monomethyl ester cyclase
MRVVLIYPRFKTRMAGGVEEPLGLLYIAAALRRDGHDVSLFDLTGIGNLECMADALRVADLVGFSSSSALFGHALEVLTYVRGVAPETPVIIGGPHATIFPEQVLDAGFDYVALGEAENSIRQFCVSLAEGKAQTCPGIAHKAEGKVEINPRPDFIRDLDDLSFPARDLLNYSIYPTIGMMATRGCPFNCLYCKPMVNHLFGRRIRHRSAANVVAEIEAAQKLLGQKLIHFKDDTLTVLEMEWFHQFEKELLDRGMTIRWQGSSRVDTITYEKLKLMRKTGCVLLCFGVETGSPRILDFYRKQATLEQAEQAFRWCHELGILPHAFIMLGAPEERKEDLELTYKLVRKIKPGTWMIYTTTPLPGSDLYAYAKEHDLLNIEGYEQFDNAENSLLGRLPMKLRYLTADDITRYRNKINRRLILANLLNPRVIARACRAPGTALRVVRNALLPRTT